MHSHFLRPFAAVAAGALMVVAVAAQQVTKKDIAGISTFAQFETTIACGGATKAEAEGEAVRAAGLIYSGRSRSTTSTHIARSEGREEIGY